jgi:chromosome segregation ATPase
MAAVKSGPPSPVAKNVALSLSSPVSLLWAHQLRREHGALLARVEGLATAVDHASAQLNEIAALMTKAETKLCNIESEHVRLKRAIERAGENAKRLSDEVAGISERVDVSEEKMRSLQTDFHTLEKLLSKGIIDQLATIERRVQEGQKEHERQVQELKTRCRDIQARLPDTVKDGVIGVWDSTDEIREQTNQIGLLVPAPPTP